MYGDRPGRILIIDDEKAIRQGCAMSLGEMGHQVEAAETGRRGLEMLQTGEWDLTLLDMRLPDLDGMEILRQVMSTRPQEYIIVMTGYSTVQNAVEALKLGAFDYLTKPFTDDELVLAVDKALEKKLLVEENQYLRGELLNRYSFSNIVGESQPMLKVFEQIEKVAPTDSTVLIVGESGTGKELVAGAIHAHSQRAAKQFVAVDCSTLSPGLLESELFGHVKGAFTGAAADKRGIFDVAQAGTLFLDDIVNLQPGNPGQAAAGPGGGRVQARGRIQVQEDQRPDHRRHQQGPQGGGQGGQFPGGPLLPVQRLSHPPPRPAPEKAGHPPAGLPFPEDALPQNRQEDRGPFGRGPGAGWSTTPGPATSGSSRT